MKYINKILKINKIKGWIVLKVFTKNTVLLLSIIYDYEEEKHITKQSLLSKKKLL